MTTIAYRDGLVSADTGLSSSTGSRVGFTSKIAKGPDGAIGGACGSAVYGEAFLGWVRSGRYGAPPTADDDTGIVVDPSGRVTVYQKGGTLQMRGPYFAIGSGTGEALGAMHAGASAEGAVHAAVAHDDGTFGDVETLRIGDQP